VTAGVFRQGCDDTFDRYLAPTAPVGHRGPHRARRCPVTPLDVAGRELAVRRCQHSERLRSEPALDGGQLIPVRAVTPVATHRPTGVEFPCCT
jgi:hypothetical protein